MRGSRATTTASCACIIAPRANPSRGADGALSQVGRQEVPGADKTRFVFAYHEVIETPPAEKSDPDRCEIHYRGALSPDFYAWIFPHGDTMSVGTGSANKGFSLKNSVQDLRDDTGLAGASTVRREGAPIPLKPLKRWDNGRDVVLAGDAAGVVAPASGEGIYYAMLGGRLSADSVEECLRTGDARALSTARKRFMKLHGRSSSFSGSCNISGIAMTGCAKPSSASARIRTFSALPGRRI
jgi:geranylgeranyl reductase